MAGLIYHLRYALRLRSRGGLTLIQAWTYPMPNPDDRGDPIEDADDEMDAFSDCVG
jgi:hypothetical protein